MEHALAPSRTGIWVPVALAAGIGVALSLLLGDNYLLFHTVVELCVSVVALTVFAIAWHTRRLASSDYLTFLGMASLAIGVVTLLHALAYKGMPVFPEYGSDLPTQLWVIARFLQASAFLIAPVFLTRQLKSPGVALAAYGVGAFIAIAATFGRVFPAAFVEGRGLTPFKVGMEYLVIAMTLAGAFGLWVKRSHLSPSIRVLIWASMAATVTAELAFTLYADPFGPWNRFGHIAHFAAYLLIYVALVQTSLERPIEALFHRLSERERALADAYEAEHDIAETLQDAIALQPERVAGLEIGHRYLPTPGRGRIGGDFFDVFRIDEHLVGFTIGDVCGKGIKAAMSTMKARAGIRAVALEDPDPARVLIAVNAYLSRELASDSFVTVIFGTVDVESRAVTLSVAGHPEPVVCGRPDVKMPDELRCPPLGVMPHLDAKRWQIELQPGDTLALVTDGVLEATGVEGQFGEERLADTLHTTCCGLSAEEVAETVIRVLTEYTHGNLNDDVAVLALRLTD